MLLLNVQIIFLLLYVVSLHCSMAGMEIFGWLTFVTAIGARIYRRQFPARTEMLWPLLAFLLAGALSLVVNPELKSWTNQIGFLRFGLIYFGLVWALNDVWSLGFERRLLWAWLGALTLVGAYGFVQMVTGIDLLPRSKQTVMQIATLWRATGFFNMSLTFAYCLGLSVLAGALRGLRGPVSVKLAWVALVCGVLGVISTSARGAWVALFVCAWIYVLVEQRKWALRFLGVSVVALVLLVMNASLFGGKIEKLLHFQIDHSSSMRFDMWRGYFAMFLDHPIFGVGLFQGDKLLAEYYTQLGIVQPFVSHAHNNFLQFLSGTGLLGFLAYCWMIFIPMKMAWSIRRGSQWGWPLLLPQIFFHIGGLTEANFLDGEVNHFLMFTWALSAMLSARFKSNLRSKS